MKLNINVIQSDKMLNTPNLNFKCNIRVAIFENVQGSVLTVHSISYQLTDGAVKIY